MKGRKKESISIQLTGKQLTILISGIFLISGLSFIFGALLMKGFKSETALDPFVKEQVVKKPAIEKEEVLSDRKPVFSKDELTFFDTLPDKDEGVKKKNGTSVKKAAPVTKKVTAAAKISPRPAESPITPTVENKRKGKYAVQVASYREKENAERLISMLMKKGYDTYIVKTDLPEKGTYYRVRIGDYENKELASKVASALFFREAKKMELSKPMVVLKGE